VNKYFPTSRKKVSDETGALPPIIQSTTRQQPDNIGESLMTGAEAIKTVTKKTAEIREGITDPTTQVGGRRKQGKAQKQTEE
jgi:hypothetical protein